MNIDNEIVQDALRIYSSKARVPSFQSYVSHLDAMKDALSYVLPKLMVKVPELEWEGGEARSSLGDLYTTIGLSENVWVTAWNGTEFKGWQTSEVLAKAAAQADYERRMLQGLEIVKAERLVNLELVRTESETPSHSHGGYACSIAWALLLNGVEIGSERDRYPWEKRKASSLTPPNCLVELRDTIRKALSLAIKPVDVAAVREQPFEINFMQRVWANLYFDEHDAGYTFQQTLNDVADWLTSRNALPDIEAIHALSAVPAQSAVDLPWRISDIKRGLILFRTSNNAHGFTNFSMLSERVENLHPEAKIELANIMRNIAHGLSPAEPAQDTSMLFGPYGHLNGNRMLSEDSWEVESDPDNNDEEHFSIPLFSKVDPFKIAGADIVADPTLEATPCE